MTRLLLAFILLFSTFGAFAQRQGREGHGRPSLKLVHEFKTKFLAQQMDLDAEQKARFTELYTQMSDEKRKVFEGVRALEKKVKANKNATDADYDAVSEAITDAKMKDAEIEKKYDAKFAAFLSKKQIFKLKEGEDLFRRKMHDMKHKRDKNSKR